MAKKPKQSTFTVTMATTEYRTNMFVNRFHIERAPTYFLLSFGLAHRGDVISFYSVIFEKSTLAANEDGMMRYLGELGPPESESPEDWAPPKSIAAPTDRRLDVCNYLQLARMGEIGELRFGLFSVGVGVDKARRDPLRSEVAASGLALLQCPIDLQKHFVIQLYGNDPKL